MDRTRHPVESRYAYYLSDDEYADLFQRDNERSSVGKPPLHQLLADAYCLSDVGYLGAGIMLTISHWEDNDDTHNLIANDIEQYIAGVENSLTGPDSD